MIRWNLTRLRRNQESTWLALDVAMLVLLSANLTWLLFDSLFSIDAIERLLLGLAPGFTRWYGEEIHPDYLRYDLLFVSVFIGEFLLRWTVAIRRKTYRRWFWYPFIHWYELLGCIPLTGFRLLRLLRIFSMAYRLQRLGVLDIADTAPLRFIQRYYRLLIEEIADRVVLKVLAGVRDEVREGHPVWRRILDEVVAPRKRLLAEELAIRIAAATSENYPPRRDEVREHVNEVIAEAVEQSQDVQRFGRLPMLGGYATEMLERSIADIVFGVIDESASNLHDEHHLATITELIEAGMETFIAQRPGTDEATNEMLIEALDVIAERVAVNRRLRRYQHY
jgi:hypothetical protein